jgi:hypothetical protein
MIVHPSRGFASFEYCEISQFQPGMLTQALEPALHIGVGPSFDVLRGSRLGTSQDASELNGGERQGDDPRSLGGGQLAHYALAPPHLSKLSTAAALPAGNLQGDFHGAEALAAGVRPVQLHRGVTGRSPRRYEGQQLPLTTGQRNSRSELDGALRLPKEAQAHLPPRGVSVVHIHSSPRASRGIGLCWSPGRSPRWRPESAESG